MTGVTGVTGVTGSESDEEDEDVVEGIGVSSPLTVLPTLTKRVPNKKLANSVRFQLCVLLFTQLICNFLYGFMLDFC